MTRTAVLRLGEELSGQSRKPDSQCGGPEARTSLALSGTKRLASVAGT